MPNGIFGAICLQYDFFELVNAQSGVYVPVFQHALTTPSVRNSMESINMMI